MEYHFSKKIINASFEEIEASVREELRKEGFGVLSEINANEIFKEKLDIDFKRYKILGACIPYAAYNLLMKEDKSGVFLPCNVIIQQEEDGTIEVTAINPYAAFMAVENDNIGCHLLEVKEKLLRVIDNA